MFEELHLAEFDESIGISKIDVEFVDFELNWWIKFWIKKSNLIRYWWTVVTGGEGTVENGGEGGGEWVAVGRNEGEDGRNCVNRVAKMKINENKMFI